MSTQKINTSKATSQTRIKKYDSYHYRNGEVTRRNKTGLTTQASIPIKSNIKLQKSSGAFKSTSNNTSNYSNLNKQAIRTPNHRRQRYINNNVALRAVASTKFKQDKMYPDNENTLYGSMKRKTSLFQKIMYGFASLILIFSGFVSVQSYITNSRAQEQIATLGDAVSRDEQGVSEGTGNEPSEEPIPESVVRNFQVANPQDPRFLRIPSLGVFSRIKNLGVTPEGAVDAPRNIFDAGWYNGSARPGSRVGSSLILGHVSGWTGPGVFKKINELPIGGEFEIEKGNGEVIRYSVTRSEQLSLDQVDMSKVLSTEVAGQHDLKLMTCSGRYNSATETYEERFIVYAKQI